MCFRIFTLKNALLIVTLALSLLANAQTESTLYTFKESASFWPQGALLEDSAGNLYGTTRGGGSMELEQCLNCPRRRCLAEPGR